MLVNKISTTTYNTLNSLGLEPFRYFLLSASKAGSDLIFRTTQVAQAAFTHIHSLIRTNRSLFITFTVIAVVVLICKIIKEKYSFKSLLNNHFKAQISPLCSKNNESPELRISLETPVKKVNRSDVPKEILYWMVGSVGPYKPIGYIEGSIPQMVQEELFKRYPDPMTRPIGDERNKINEEIKNAITTQLIYDLNEMKFDNGFILSHDASRTYAYNREAIFEVLRLNIDVIAKHSDFEEEESHFLRNKVDLYNATDDAQIKKEQLDQCADLLATKLNHQICKFTAFIHALFGDRNMNRVIIDIREDKVFLSSSGDETGDEIRLPDKGISELHRLQAQFPTHSWDTIRFFLVYFHRHTNQDPLNETIRLLKHLPADGNNFYYIHDDQIFSTNSSILC